jgi:hypothetical protein
MLNRVMIFLLTGTLAGGVMTTGAQARGGGGIGGGHFGGIAGVHFGGMGAAHSGALDGTHVGRLGDHHFGRVRPPYGYGYYACQPYPPYDGYSQSYCY